MGPNVEEGEPLVSQDVCTTLIDASKRAIRRCRDLCHDKELAETLKALYITLLQRLCVGHFKEGLDFAIQGEVVVSGGVPSILIGLPMVSLQLSSPASRPYCAIMHRIVQ